MNIAALQLIADLRQQLDRLEGLLHVQPSSGRPLPTSYSCLDHQLRATLEEVARSYSVTPEEVLGRRRTGAIADARLMFYFLAYNFVRVNRRQIAAFMGSRDPSTVSHGIAEMKARTVLDRAVSEKFHQLKTAFFP